MGLPTKLTIRKHSRRPGTPVEPVSDALKLSDLALSPRSAMQWLADFTCKSLSIDGEDYILREKSGKEWFRGDRSNAIIAMYEVDPTILQEYADLARQEGYPEEKQLAFRDFLLSGPSR